MALILIVDDDPQLRAAAGRVLRLHGHETLEAADAREARQRVEESETAPQVALMDLVLPDLAGRELASVLQTHVPGIKIIFTSGFTSREGRDLDVADHFLRKPFSVPDLVAAVQEALSGSRDAAGGSGSKESGESESS
jgi:CheY-like chemotaxis protein